MDETEAEIGEIGTMAVASEEKKEGDVEAAVTHIIIYSEVSKFWNSVAREFRWGMLWLDSTPIELKDQGVEDQYCRIAWSTEDGDSLVFKNMVYRFCQFMFLLFCSMISITSYVDESNIKRSSGDYVVAWYHVFAHWVVMIQVVQQLHDLIVSIGLKRVMMSVWYMRLTRLCRAFACPLSVHNLFTFYFLRYEWGDEINNDILWSVFLPASVVFVDAVTGSHRSPRILHVVYPILFGSIYIGFSGVHYHVTDGHEVVSQAMDWGHPADAWRDVFMNMFGICPMTVCVMWTLMYVRERWRPIPWTQERDPRTGLPVMRD